METSLYKLKLFTKAFFLLDIEEIDFSSLPHHCLTGPDSANGRVSASGAGGRGFDPGPHHTKGVKVVPVATLLGAQHYKAKKDWLFSHSLLTLHKN